MASALSLLPASQTSRGSPRPGRACSSLVRGNTCPSHSPPPFLQCGAGWQLCPPSWGKEPPQSTSTSGTGLRHLPSEQTQPTQQKLWTPLPHTPCWRGGSRRPDTHKHSGWPTLLQGPAQWLTHRGLSACPLPPHSTSGDCRLPHPTALISHAGEDWGDSPLDWGGQVKSLGL